ncbi:hypothetical protein GCM10011513_39420 [Franconibacter daqui]|uniref:two-partner secretion domain-containing protein n=2 Tax=Franconibacter daqui TaxID=2047724 RepID=UPI00166B7B5C|nr:filamentous hemagglutinin N-terminal domain-containing protein [Franconibacter daqui]GGD37761.1 hypothetical protein GCM10011513_39420 [Franconibacter daqui]
MKNKGMRSVKKNKHVLHANLAPVCFATMLALGMVLPVQAAVVADNSAANQPSVHTGANGATIVDINKASAEGVSHNVYSQFNVDQNGVILNNSGGATNTQLAGQINGNANMAGGSAKVILNEVRSADPSQLNGMVEVAGQSAQVIIANPSGITCNGCGFINTNHATLTTGTASIDAQGKVNGLDVKKGQIVITGKGMDTSSTQYTDIIARSVKVNAQLKANELNITTGSNHIDKNGRVKAIAATGDAPELALDVSSLGSMYANKIYMKGTEAGVGVRLDHADLTATDSLSIEANGTINNNGGHLSAKNSVMLNSQQDVLNSNSQITADGDVMVSAQGRVDNHGGTIKGGNVNVYGGKTVNNAGGSIHGTQAVDIISNALNNTDGDITSDGNITINRGSYNYYNSSKTDGVVNKNGHINAKGNMTIDSANVYNEDGSISANSSLNINTGTLNNNKGVIASGNANDATWTQITASELKNDNGSITATGENSELMVMGNNALTNHDGSIVGEGNVTFNGVVDNSAGKIAAGKDMHMYVNGYASDADSSLTSGQNMDLMVNGTFQNAGAIKSGQDLLMSLGGGGWYGNSGSASNTGIIDAAGRLSVQSNSNVFDNSGSISAGQMDWQILDLYNRGSIASRGDMNFNANNINNFAQGKISADNDINVYTAALMNEKDGQIEAGHSASFNLTNNFDNSGEIKATNDVNVTSLSYRPASYANKGNILGGDNVNINFAGSHFANTGTIKGDKAVNIDANSLYNSGEISSAGNVTLASANDIINDVNGKITGDKVITRGRVNNMGEITQTGEESDSADNGNTTPDNGNVTPDNGNNTPDNGNNIPDNGNNTPDNGDSIADNTQHADGFDGNGGVWINGVNYASGKEVNGVYIRSVQTYPDGSFIISAGAGSFYGKF